MLLQPSGFSNGHWVHPVHTHTHTRTTKFLHRCPAGIFPCIAVHLFPQTLIIFLTRHRMCVPSPSTGLDLTTVWKLTIYHQPDLHSVVCVRIRILYTRSDRVPKALRDQTFSILRHNNTFTHAVYYLVCKNELYLTIWHASGYRGSDLIQGRYIFNTGRFGTMWCNWMQSNTVLNICFIESYSFHHKCIIL